MKRPANAVPRREPLHAGSPAERRHAGARSRGAVGLAAQALALVGAIGCTGEDPPELFSKPYRDEWRREVDLDFRYIVNGTVQISTITIGGAPVGQGENFANRGDVVVEFHDQEKIFVDVRRFTSSRSKEGAEEDFADLVLVATNGTLADPDDIDADKRCNEGEWKDGCQIRIYYRGQTQLARSGADFHVVLPREYRHKIIIYTGDNTESDDYENRGDVCVDGANATVEARLANGLAFVKLADDTTPMPRCTLQPNLYNTCVSGDRSTWWREQDGEGGDGCGCISQIGEFGRVKIDSLDNAAATAVVQVPENLWTDINLINEATGQMRGTSPACQDTSPAGTRCDACVDLPDYEFDASVGDDSVRSVWENRGVAWKPNAEVTAGGFAVALTAKACQDVRFTESPRDFVGENQGNEQESEERGNLTVCHDCLTGKSCLDLISGL